MTASHGRVGRTGLAWFATTLAASGLFLAVSGGRPARACHIHHNTETDHSTSTTATHPHPSTPPMTLAQALQNYARDLHDQTMPTTPPVVTPTSGMTHPAAEFLTPPVASTPTVRNWHQTAPPACTPTTPPPSIGGTATIPAGQVIIPSPSAASSTGLQGSPTPAPEPSTIFSALALVGAFAWRRRAGRSRG
jgi:MYXO-CTERM domain-containing protein